MQNLNPFSYSEPKINFSDEKKWYIAYTIKFISKHSDPSQKQIDYRKEFGLKSYLVRMNDKHLLDSKTERLAVANKLLFLVEKDLKNGIDPKFRSEIVDAITIEKIKESKQLHFDVALEIVKEVKGYLNPEPTKELSARNIVDFLRVQFKRYLIKIGKEDNVLAVTQDDIIFYIDSHFNPDKELKVKEWGATTCKVKKGWIGIFFSALMVKRHLSVNPASGIPSKKDNQKLHRSKIKSKPLKKKVRYEVWTDEEFEIFNTHLNTNNLLLEKCAGYCCYYGYIRRSELLRIRLWMIDFDNNRFTFPSDITKSSRKYDAVEIVNVKIAPQLKEILEKYINAKFGKKYDEDELLFPPLYEDGYENYQAYSKYFVKVLSELGIKKNLYSLKHTGVTAFFKKNLGTQTAPIKLMTFIRNQCRHSDFSETQKYMQALDLLFDDEENDFIW